jgi:hypothetical protein
MTRSACARVSGRASFRVGVEPLAGAVADRAQGVAAVVVKHDDVDAAGHLLLCLRLGTLQHRRQPQGPRSDAFRLYLRVFHRDENRISTTGLGDVHVVQKARYEGAF